MAFPTLAVTEQGDALALSSLPGAASLPTGWHVALYNATTGPSEYGAVLGDFTEPTDINYARQEITGFGTPLDDGTLQFRVQMVGIAVIFSAFAFPDSILGRLIISPDGNLYAWAPFPTAIGMGPTSPAISITPILTMKSEI